MSQEGKAKREEFDVVAGRLNAQHGHLVDAAIWTLENELHWQGEGLTAPESFLAWRFAISPATARTAVAIARRADELPECVQALRDGLLSFDQVAAIVRHAPGWADRQVLNLCERLTVSQIRRTLSRYSWPDDPNGPAVDDEATDASDEPATAVDDDAPDAAESMVDDEGDGDGTGELVVGQSVGQPSDASPDAPRSTTAVTQPADTVVYGRGPDGRWFLHANLGADLGEIVQKSLDESRDRQFHEGNTTANGVDALVDLAERSVDAVASTERRNRFRTNIHLQADGQATDDLGRPLPDCISRHITCDGLIAPVFLEGGLPVSVGRSQYIVPDRTRRIVIQRDGGCSVPGCNHTGHIEVHHIIHWSDDGPTETWNLISLCPRHHRWHHQGRLGITGNADLGTVVFTNQHGRRLVDCAARPVAPDCPSPDPAGTFRPPLGERLNSDYVSFPHPSTLSHDIRRNVRT